MSDEPQTRPEGGPHQTPGPGTVTVSRQYGAGGLRVGPAIARALGFRFVDRELVELAARQLGVDPGWAQEHDERVPDVLENLGRALAAATPEFGIPPPPVLDDRAMAEAVRNVIHSLAETGGYVILGRASQAALAERPDVANVWLVGDQEDRIARVVRSQGLQPKEARERMERTDRDRGDYVKRFYGQDIADPRLYDAVVNTSRLGLERATRIAVWVARIKLSAAAS
jgi:cytidylate kinase